MTGTVWGYSEEKRPSRVYSRFTNLSWPRQIDKCSYLTQQWAHVFSSSIDRQSESASKTQKQVMHTPGQKQGRLEIKMLCYLDMKLLQKGTFWRHLQDKYWLVLKCYLQNLTTISKFSWKDWLISFPSWELSGKIKATNSGNVILVNIGVISWCSDRQEKTALCTAAAETIAIAKVAVEIKYLRAILLDSMQKSRINLQRLYRWMGG